MDRFELSTFRLSDECSNLLSYIPKRFLLVSSFSLYYIQEFIERYVHTRGSPREEPSRSLAGAWKGKGLHLRHLELQSSALLTELPFRGDQRESNPHHQIHNLRYQPLYDSHSRQDGSRTHKIYFLRVTCMPIPSLAYIFLILTNICTTISFLNCMTIWA